MRYLLTGLRKKINPKKKGRQILLLGANDITYFLATSLSRLGEEVVVVGKSDALRKFKNLDILVVPREELISWKDLIYQAKYICCLTESDDFNLFWAFQAKHWFPGIKTIVMASQIITNELEKGKIIDFLVRPGRILIEEIRKYLNYGVCRLNGQKILVLLKSRFKQNPGEIDRIRNYYQGCLLKSLVLRNNKFLEFAGAYKLYSDDRVFFLLSISDRLLTRNFLPVNYRGKLFFLIEGGWDTGVASALKGDGHEIFVITTSKRKEEIAEEYPDLMVFNTHPLDTLALREEGVEEARGLLALSSDENLNILWTMMGRSLKVRRSIPLFYHQYYADFADLIRLQPYLYLPQLLGSKIINYIYSPEINFLIEDDICVMETEKNGEDTLPENIFCLKERGRGPGFKRSPGKLVVAGRKKDLVYWIRRNRR